MKKTKFTEFLKIIKGKTRRDLQDFISVTSNQLSPQEKEIFTEILQRLDSNRKIDEDEIVDTFLQGERKKWNRMKNHFVKVIKRYLIMDLAQHEKPWSDLILLNFFHENNMEKNLSSDLKKVLHAITEQTLDERNSLQRFLVHEFEVKRGKNKRTADESLDLMTRNLDYFYLENRLRCLCEQINRKHIINTHYDSAHFITFIEQEISNIHSPGVNIYYNLYKMLTAKQKESYFLKVNEWIDNNLEAFTKEYIKEVYDRLMNFCIRRINSRETHYAEKYLHYVDILSEKSLFLESGKLSALRYKNCISISLVANNITWANNFMALHSEHLEPSIKEDAYKFNKAQVQFYSGDYEKSQQSLLGFQPFDMYYKIASDKLSLVLSCHQVLKGKYNITIFKTKLESLRRYAQAQKKLSADKKEKLTFFINALSKLSRNKKAAIEKLLAKIPIMDYLWIKKIQNYE